MENELGLLSDTGFNTFLELQAAKKNYRQALAERKTEKEAIAITSGEVIGNVYGFLGEYIRNDPLLVNPLSRRVVRGRERIVNRFSKLPVLDAISNKERDGSVKEAFTLVEDFLLKAKRGSMAVIVSPEGPSGLTDRRGRSIVYPDTQVYLFRVGEGRKPQAYTLVLDNFDIKRSKLLLRLLGLPKTALDMPWLTEQADLANVVKNVALIESNGSGGFRFEDVIRIAQSLKLSDKAKGERSFGEVYQNLSQGEKLLRVDQDCQRVLTDLQIFLDRNLPKIDNSFVQRRIAQEIDLSILKIARLSRGNDFNINNLSLKTPELLSQVSDKFMEELKYLRSIPGCNGGGSSILGRTKVDSIGPRVGLIRKGSCHGCQASNVEVGSCNFCTSCEAQAA